MNPATWSRWTLSMPLFTLSCLAAACGGGQDPADSCAGVTCAGHGTCVLVVGEAICTCEQGYEPDPGDPLSCVSSQLQSIVVDVVTGMSAPVDQVITVSLRSNPDVSLTLGTAIADVWEDMLRYSQSYPRPIYLDLDPETRAILDVEQPLVSTIERLVPTDEALRVELTYSAAIHFLYPTNPRFQEMADFLHDALANGDSVVVTERHAEGIIDVRADTF